MGWPLPMIAIGFTVYALAGPYFPGLLKHAGASWSQMINHQYLTSQGIYGVAVGVVATYVFHFVLFGVMATRIGLGQLFLDIAASIAGRYAGGPAKVSVFGSAMFGMLSGSSVANAVTVGSLTIPAMIRVGYQARVRCRRGSRLVHRRADHAAGSGCGGLPDDRVPQRAPTRPSSPPPSCPAFMHFFGVFMQVHFEAKRYGLRGLTEAEMPRLRESLRQRWPTLIPLVLLISILVTGRTPYLAAFTGITSCAIVGLTTQTSGNTAKNWLMLVVLHARAAADRIRRARQNTEWLKLAFSLAVLPWHWRLELRRRDIGRIAACGARRGVRDRRQVRAGRRRRSRDRRAS